MHVGAEVTVSKTTGPMWVRALARTRLEDEQALLIGYLLPFEGLSIRMAACPG